MAQRRRTKFEKWLAENQSVFAELASAVRSIIETALNENGIPHLSVTGRAKTVSSAVRKARIKGYRQPKQETTDLAGIRVVTFTQTDADRVCTLLRTIFRVDEKRSVDKSAALKVNRVGYRSHHLICQLDDVRVKLVEFKKFASVTFEVQVRTVLQHAWAEIEHSRNYKFSGVLPATLGRSLNLVAGLLEVADNQIVQLAGAIETYQKEIQSKTKSGDLNLEITSASLESFLAQIAKRFKRLKVRKGSETTSRQIVAECKSFGIGIVEDMNKLVTKSFIALCDKHKLETTSIGLARSILMFADLDTYFEKAHQNHWVQISPETFRLLSEKYPQEKLRAVLHKHSVRLQDEELSEAVDEEPDLSPDEIVDPDEADPDP